MSLTIMATSENIPKILQVTPTAAIPGGEFQIRGNGLTLDDRAVVKIGDVSAPIVVGSGSFVIARVPEGAGYGELVIGEGDRASQVWTCDIGVQIADSLHPVANPAVDAFGNVFCTFSGARGQKTPVSVFKIDLSYSVTPFITDLMNATSLAFDRDGMLYISSRQEGTVYQSTPTGSLSVFVEGMGVATGLAFDDEGNLYVGDRSGTIFKISPTRQIYVFATIEPSIAAYHLAFGPDRHLYVTGPTTSSFDSITRVTPEGEVETWYRGLGRPQGMAFDAEGRLYVAASISGRRGIVRIDGSRQASLFLSGPNIVGLAFTPSRAMMVSTTNSLYRVDVNIAGKPLP
ncbi:MAG: gluconolaconase [Bryobacteraceae bacterium]